MIPHLLDNPAWAALVTAQAGFAAGTEKAKRYDPAVLPFAAISSDGVAADLDPLVGVGESFYLIGELPAFPKHWTLELELPCSQLLAPEDLRGLPEAPRESEGEISEKIVPLGRNDKDEMYRLINAVQPGYYLPDTYRLGEYFGIRRANRLVAMAGERMRIAGLTKMPIAGFTEMRIAGLTELSAVCTLPEYTGRGYAQQLMARLIREQLTAGIRPFLHVSTANVRALRLYAHLGFRRRRDITFWRVRKTGG